MNNTHYILAENTLFEVSFNSLLKLLRFQMDRISRKGVFCNFVFKFCKTTYTHLCLKSVEKEFII